VCTAAFTNDTTQSSVSGHERQLLRKSISVNEIVTPEHKPPRFLFNIEALSSKQKPLAKIVDVVELTVFRTCVYRPWF